MTEASIALNRFGLGGRPGETVSADPKRWLVDQFERFDARPQAIAALTPSNAIVGELTDYQRQLRETRRATGTARPQQAAQPQRRRLQQQQQQPMMMMEGGADAMAMTGANAAAAAAVAPGEQGNDPVAMLRRQAGIQARGHYTGAISARTAVAVTGDAPFVERLTHFWANHFAVSADKQEMTALVGSLEFEAIRPHVLGKFGDMLHAVERHPAMLVYLDQVQSVGPNSPIAQRRGANGRLGLNENLAREIMELHTLGVRSVYTQADVTEFARAMTGRTITGLGRGGAAIAAQPGNFVFAPGLHEPGARTILGKSWNDPGERQAEAVIDMLATHPATAKHIATKLARHFAGDEPPAPLVARLEASFLKSGGDLPTVYRTLVASPECWVAQPVKFKSPWEWTVSTMRALGVQQFQPQQTNGLLTQLGQPVWKPGSPAGWDDVAGSWAGPDAIMRRVEAAERMAQRTRGTIDARARAAELFPQSVSATTAQAIACAESPSQGIALMLVAPEMMRR